MDERLNIGREVRELKLGSTFAPQNSQTAFHTLKYDFKPASVDLSKVANLDVSSNNQVTVTVPNLESSGVPHTVFKGNQRTYAKECLLIFDRKTGTVTLEKLNHNIQVKKTRSEPPPAQKLAAPPPQKVENNTQRTSSKTRVSTGVRKNAIIGFVPRSSPMQQGSPSYPHKSPQSAPAWNANSGQSTLPSIPMIGMDDDIVMPQQQQQPPQQCPPPSSLHINNQMSMSGNSLDQFHPMHQQQQQQQFNVQNSHHHHYNQQQQQQQQQQFHQQQQPQHPNNNSGMAIGSGSLMGASTAAAGPPAPIGGVSTLEQEIGVLSSSDSSSDSESSESGSDSDDSADNAPQKSHHHHHHQQQQQQQSSHHNQPMYSNHQPRFENGSLPALLHDDLQLSESNSSDSDS